MILTLFPIPLKTLHDALTGVARWVGRHPVDQKVTGSIPGQCTCLGCGPGPQIGGRGGRGGVGGNQSIFLSHTLMFSFSFSSPLSKYK